MYSCVSKDTILVGAVLGQALGCQVGAHPQRPDAKKYLFSTWTLIWLPLLQLMMSRACVPKDLFSRPHLLA